MAYSLLSSALEMRYNLRDTEKPPKGGGSTGLDRGGIVCMIPGGGLRTSGRESGLEGQTLRPSPPLDRRYEEPIAGGSLPWVPGLSLARCPLSFLGFPLVASSSSSPWAWLNSLAWCLQTRTAAPGPLRLPRAPEASRLWAPSSPNLVPVSACCASRQSSNHFHLPH